MERKRVIDQGAYWRVGDGKSIDIWRDRWINKPLDFKPQQRDFNMPTPMTIDKFILPETRNWNLDMIKELFHMSDVSFVTQLHLSHKTKIDKMIWKDSIIEVFSVRSAYFVARKVLGREDIVREG